MENEKDLEYSEIMEMATLQPIPSPPKSELADTQFGTYVNVADILEPKPGPSGTSTMSPSPTFKRYSSIEESDVVVYENVVPELPIRGGLLEMTASTDRILTDLNVENGRSDQQEDILSLKTRLRIKKQRLNGLEFASYAMEGIYEEVEKIICIDVIFFLFSVLVLSLGCMRLDSCHVSPRTPVVMVACGLLDGMSHILSICASSSKDRHCKQCLSDFTRVARLIMFFMHIYGMVVVYKSLPPEEKDHSSPNYCDALAYWAAFCYFNITFASTVIIWMAMITGASCYFL